ncbi:MAG: lysylphosphatidylglycerol synthase domain-containing protein, partial [Acidimicrobiales bacterium]
LRFRKTGDHRPFVTVRQAIEHEALVTLQATTLGVPAPRIIAVSEAGVDGMVMGFEPVNGRDADAVGDIDDDGLVAIWAAVSKLHRHRIAHRDLRLANVVLDADNRPWLTRFRHAELAASDQLLGTDVAELLASTAAAVGVERAVDAAAGGIGLEGLQRAMPWLQPLALTSATRRAIGGADGLRPVRELLIDRCGVTPEEPIKLHRVDTKLLFIVATVVLSAWFLIPQLADIDTIWEQARHASGTWAAAAVGFSIVTYLAATASLLGAIPYRLRFGPALLAQIASSFANRVTPAKVGGVALNIRYFQRRGVPAAVGVTAVGLNAAAGVIVHVTLTVGFLLLASSSNSATGLTIPSPTTLGAVATGVAAVLAVLVWVPTTRRLFFAHVVPQLRAGMQSIATIGHNPARLGLLLGGSTVITLAYLGAMVASLEAFGSTASLPVVALLFLTGSAVANAAPTPGGLGGAEAALIAALSTVEEVSIVIPAVFLFRLVTFWLPILPGWAALTYLRQTDRL